MAHVGTRLGGVDASGGRGEILISAGEASGDLHGSRLVSAIRQLDPEQNFFGLGSENLARAGTDLIERSERISVVGIAEAIRIIPEARRIFRSLLGEVDRRVVRGAVLIDFPDFNLRLAKALHTRGIPVIYYISPQVWAWRQGRVRTIARVVEQMLVVFPFEVEFYQHHEVHATCVGHPLVDEVPVLGSVWDAPAEDRGAVRIALLPGSRTSEVEANLPPMIGALERLVKRGNFEISLVQAQTVDSATIQRYVRSASFEVEMVGGEQRFATLATSHLALCASGTATLEVGLVGTPMIVVYRVSPWTYLLGSMLVRLPHISLVNLVLQDRVVPELIQGDANPATISREIEGLIGDDSRIGQMRARLKELRGRLGESGATRRAAEEVLRVLGPSSAVTAR